MPRALELAIDGGAPVRRTPFAPWPVFSEDEVQTAACVLRSGKVNYWTGDEGRYFEREHAAFSGTKYAIAVSNGTVALELALWALGIGAGDEVVTPSRTFIASASSVVMRGAVPVMADVDRKSGNITAGTIRAALSPRTRAIMAVHLAGWPCEMDAIIGLARERDLFVIEDCAQASGAMYKGRPVGSIGDVGCFSFCQDKIMSTGGEGGMLVTSDERVWARAWSFKDHGKCYDAVHARHDGNGFRWLHEAFGTNWRMTEMQAALGRSLLRKVPERVAKRRRLAAILNNGFDAIPGLRIAVPAHGVGHAFYKYYVYMRPEMLLEEWTRDRVIRAITAEGIPCFSGSCSEIYMEKAFSPAMRPPRRLRVARELGETSLQFLVHPTLTEQDMRETVAAVSKVMAVAAARRVAVIRLAS